MLLFALCMYIYINPSLLLFVAIAATAPIALPRLLDSRLKNNRLLFLQKSEAYVQSNTEILNGFEVLHDFQAAKYCRRISPALRHLRRYRKKLRT